MKISATPQFVAIVGGSGSGKSLLANLLKGLLGGQAGKISLDDFYRDRSHLSPVRRARINYDSPRAIDWPYFSSAMQALQTGRTVWLPRYDFATHTRLPRGEMHRARPLMLVEGLWLLRPAHIRRSFDLKIYLRCPAQLRMVRRLRRDCAERSRDRREARRNFRSVVAPMHRRYVEPQVRWADVVLSQPPPETEVKELADRIWELLERQTLLPSWMRATFRADLSELLKKRNAYEH